MKYLSIYNNHNTFTICGIDSGDLCSDLTQRVSTTMAEAGFIVPSCHTQW